MRKLLLVIVLVILLLGTGLGAEVPKGLIPVKATIEGPDKIDAYKIVEVKVAAPVGAAWEAGGWRIRDITNTVGHVPVNPDKRIIDSLGTCLWTAPPGTYDCEATLVNFTNKTFFQDAKIIIINDYNIEPKPVPPVDPPVPPEPGEKKIGSGKLWLICVLSSATLPTPGVAAIQSNVELRQLIDSKGNHFRWIDQTVAAADLAPYVRLAEAEGLPRALVASAEDFDISKASTVKDLVRESIPLISATEVITLVKKWSK